MSPISRSHRVSGYWLCQLAGWSTYVAVTIIQLRQLAPVAMAGARPFIETLLAAALGVTLTHLLRRAAKRGRWTRLAPWAFIGRMLAATALVVLVHVGVLGFIELGVYGDRPQRPALMIVAALARWGMVFFLWLAIYLAIALLRERQRAELEALEFSRATQTAKLRSLESQLNPHFLFNSLNSVRALIAEDPAAAQSAVTQLARMLRYTLGAGQEDTVTFERELQIVDDYIGLESLRLAERLRVEREIGEHAQLARLPVMLLQTLVENAIKHGIAHLPGGGTLRISARHDGGALTLEVENPRPMPAPPQPTTESGIGLANASERLKLLFGDSARLELDLSSPGLATASAYIPQTLQFSAGIPRTPSHR